MGLRFLTSGESHGPALVAILEGMPAGLSLNINDINQQLSRRQKGHGSGDRMKLENDQVEILSGVMEGRTIGSPIALKIVNKNHEKWRGKAIKAYTTPRPGHADLAGLVKYGFDDIRPVLERASARETAARTAIGAICKQLFAHFNIQIGAYVTAIGSVSASLDHMTLAARIQEAQASSVRCPDPDATSAMENLIDDVIEKGDTLGGIIEAVATGLPVGLGSYVQWDRRLDTRLGAAIMSIPAIKGVEIGPAFENTRLPGTQVQDPIHMDNGNLTRPSNNAGGIEGGMTNGQPLIIRAAMKPIPTTITPQPTVDLAAGKETQTTYERSDTCPVPRAVPVVESVMAFVLADAMLEKLGGDSMDELQAHYESLRQVTVEELTTTATEHLFWPDIK
jgi:chorismate synthase